MEEFTAKLKTFIEAGKNNDMEALPDAARAVAKMIYSSKGDRGKYQEAVRKKNGLDYVAALLKHPSSESCWSAGTFMTNQMCTKSPNKSYRRPPTSDPGRAYFKAMDPHVVIIVRDHTIATLSKYLESASGNFRGLIFSTLSTIAAGSTDDPVTNQLMMEFADSIVVAMPDISGAARLAGNLCYHEPNQDGLVRAGILNQMRTTLQSDNKSARTGALISTALLIGGEPDHPLLSMPPDCISTVIEALEVSLTGKSMAGTFYSSNKVCMALAKLCGNDNNKSLIIEAGAVAILLKVLALPSASDGPRPAAQFALECLWQLAYNDQGRRHMDAKGVPAVVNSFAKSKHKKIAKNVQGFQMVFGGISNAPTGASSKKKSKEKKSADGKLAVMISYNWAVQPLIIKLKQTLEAYGIDVWLDLEQMAGSTLEAMANAVETSDVIVVAMSQKYLESANCRLEAEYAQTRKKRIVPLMMQPNWQPKGWLGLVVGAKLWFPYWEDKQPEFDQTTRTLVSELKQETVKVPDDGADITVLQSSSITDEIASLRAE